MYEILILLAAAQSVDTPRPVAIGPETWVRYEDYPAEAVRQAWNGRAAFSLLVDKGGAVKSCTITQSSGHTILDQKTCEILMLRARFEPAKDGSGSPIESIYSSGFTWRLPAEIQGRDRVVTFSEHDRNTNCSIKVADRKRMLAQPACDTLVDAMKRTGRALRPTSFWLLDSIPLVPE